MEIIKDAKEIISKRKYSSFFALGGLIVAAAVDSHVVGAHSVGTILTDTLFQAIGGAVVSQAIFQQVTKNKDDSEAMKSVKKAAPVAALVALGSYFVTDFMNAGMPLANTAKEVAAVGGFGSTYFAASVAGSLAVKKFKEYKKKLSI